MLRFISAMRTISVTCVGEAIVIWFSTDRAVAGR